MQYKGVIHVSRQAIVFRAVRGSTPVAVKWSKSVDEPALHKRAAQLINKQEPGTAVRLICGKLFSHPVTPATFFRGPLPSPLPDNVATHSLTKAKQSAILVMPLYQGSAQDLIDRGNFHGADYEDVIQTMEKACTALEDATPPLRYGKPRPSNILYQGSGRNRKWALTDFDHLQPLKRKGDGVKRCVDALEKQLPE